MMAIDARIPLGVQQFSLADLLRNAEAIQGARSERAAREQAIERQAAQDKRGDAFRMAASDYLLNRGGGVPAPGATAPGAAPLPGPAPSPTGRLGDLVAVLDQAATAEAPLAPSPAAAAGPAAPSPRDAAFARMVEADPTAALAARRAELVDASDQLSLIGRLAGSAVDEDTYQAALRQAQSIGLDTSNLPQRYVPQFVETLRRQALSAQQQIAAEISRMRLELDARDDVADNERADEALEMLGGYRGETLDLRREEERGRNRRFEEGEEGRNYRDDSDDDDISPSDVVGRLLDRVSRGETLTFDEQNALRLHRGQRPLRDTRPSWLRTAEQVQRIGREATEPRPTRPTRARPTRGGLPDPSRFRDGAIIRNPATGERARLVNGGWEPIR